MRIHNAQGTILATRFDLDRWMKALPQPWSAAMEATMFKGWIYDHLQPHAAALKVAHPPTSSTYKKGCPPTEPPIDVVKEKATPRPRFKQRTWGTLRVVLICECAKGFSFD